ncbi:hypothetical protein [Oceaniglobus indicus]|uniref:hypothetical protein n=1 Tax=Oceaniglobus indicus TaxID=2047749 RepID=UPI000C18B3CF|nr:hypothetical protein [Oceaniglobus indicus]
MGARHGAILAVVAALAGAGAAAGPADRVLRACAAGPGGDPAATLMAEGWQQPDASDLPAVHARIGLLADATEASTVRFPLDVLRTDEGQREVRGRKRLDRDGAGARHVFLTPGDGTTVVQITTHSAPRPTLYCMISTVGNREAAEIGRRLIALTDRDKVQGFGGIISAQSARTPPDVPTKDVSATPLPDVWQLLTIDLDMNGDLADADMFIEGFWWDRP